MNTRCAVAMSAAAAVITVLAAVPITATASAIMSATVSARALVIPEEIITRAIGRPATSMAITTVATQIAPAIRKNAGPATPARRSGAARAPSTRSIHRPYTCCSRANARGVDDLFSELANTAGVQSLAINGPLNPTGPGDTPSRRRIFSCRPATPADEVPCARQIVSALATRALRKPVNENDPTIETLLGFFESGRKLRGFESGIQYALARVLVDPQFIYRFERAPTGLRAGAVYRISDLELASRLSFFLWSSIPDEELLGLAAKGRLADPTVLEQQTRRMLSDARARALIDNLAGQWLQLRQLDDVAPGTKEFDGSLRYAFRRETELLFETIVRDDRSILDLIDADFTYVDERLARHYGIPNIRGSRFRNCVVRVSSTASPDSSASSSVKGKLRADAI